MLKQSIQTGKLEHHIRDEQIDASPNSPNPFPGLRPFTIEESHLFFGREDQADDILVKLSKNKFVTIMGYSGSGKSSLMYCGLIPVLYGGFMTEKGAQWNIITSRPGTSPIANLASAIVTFLIRQGKINTLDKTVHLAIINSVLRNGPNGLIEVSKYLETYNSGNVFFLIDQFEELFRFRDKQSDKGAIDESQLYVNLILTAVTQTKLPIYAALTMRSDFIGNCSVFPGLTQLINSSNYLVPQMAREQKKMAIEGPIAVGGGKISQRLVKRLLSDVGNDQDMLPILQHALMRTWDYWIENHEPGEQMDLRHYNAIGKITQALSQHANEAYDELSTREKEIAEILFKSITEKNQENKELRRPGRLGLVAELAEANEQDVIKIVDHFRRSGRSFLMPAAHVTLNSDSIIEISHESLMRIWNRLDGWVEEEFESAQMYKRLSEAAAMYQIGKTGLWRPPDLQLALNWQKKQKPSWEWAQRYDDAFERSIVFLDTSRITYEAELKNQEMLQKRVLSRTRATAIILGVAAVIAILFFVFAYIQKIAADEQSLLAATRQSEAEKQSKIAEESRKNAEKQKEIALQRQDEREKAYAVVEETLIKLQDAINKADVAKNLALKSAEYANIQRDSAQVERNKAQQEFKRAEENFQKADRLYMLAIAQSLSTKSIQEEDDQNLAGLLAMQGYVFHRRFDGKKYDPYIYGGLYAALKKLNGASYNGMKTIGSPHNHLKSLAVSHKTSAFYASGADGRIFIGDFSKLTNKPTLYYTPYPSKVIALSKDENYLVNGSDSSIVQIYSLQSKKDKPIVIKGISGGTNDIEFLPDNSGFIIATADKTIKLINHLTGLSTDIITLPYETKSISISPDGNKLACAAWSGQVMLVDLENSTYNTLLEENASRILSVRFSPDGRFLACGIEDNANKRGLVKLYNLETKESRQFTGHRAGVYDVEFSPDGKLLASAGSDKRLQMWVLDNPEDLPIVMDNNNGFVWDISFSKGSDYLIATCSESEIRVWPTDPSLLAQQICPKLKRNMTPDEWKKYVGEKIGFEITCIVGALIKDY